MKYYPALALVAASLIASTSSCSRTSGASNPVAAIEASDSLPREVKQLVRVVSGNDADGFADLIDYPLERPYPLRNIPDKGSMTKYYPLLVDDSLRTVLTRSTPDQWQEYGWRGWSVGDGSYLWLTDGRVVSVNYVSAKETAMRDSIVKMDVASLAPALRSGGWTPVACLRASDGSSVFRIDISPERKSGPAYRLLKFSLPVKLNAPAEAIYEGYMETEGSMMIPTWRFSAPDGNTAEYTDYPGGADQGSRLIIFSVANGEEHAVEVVPDYWLDLIR